MKAGSAPAIVHKRSIKSNLSSNSSLKVATIETNIMLRIGPRIIAKKQYINVPTIK
jgi:hypothetical protein